MSANARIPLADARLVADEVLAVLSPACERIEVAGSIRRGVPTCGDIEVVCIPSYGEPVRDLFGNVAADGDDLLHRLCEELLTSNRLQLRFNKLGRPAWGPKLKWCMYWPDGRAPIALDIYACDAATWGATMAIRTGPADFSHRLVTPKAAGGYCPAPLQFKGWRVVERASGEPLPTPEEEDLFRVLGLDWLAPGDRR